MKQEFISNIEDELNKGNRIRRINSDKVWFLNKDGLIACDSSNWTFTSVNALTLFDDWIYVETLPTVVKDSSNDNSNKS